MAFFPKHRTFHFIGIGGAGMSAIADILLEMGHKVSGSDRQASDMTDYLQRRGAKVFIGQKEENVDAVDFVVYTSAVSRDNPEMQAAKKKSIPCIRRAEMLGQLMFHAHGIAVAGTHGKTTTTSMIAKILIDANLDPTVLVGGKMQNLNANARLGRGEYLIAEADEYDRSLLALFPKISVVTSLEEDHMDIYKDLNDLKNTFLKFINQTMFDGLAVINGDETHLAKLLPMIVAPNITYGLNKPARLMAKDLKYDSIGSSFDVFDNDEKIGSIKLQIPGKHNVKNALAAIAVGLQLDIPFATIASAINDFNGVQRRFEQKGTIGDTRIVDDYAHHPTEVATTLEAAQIISPRQVLVVFQPHLFSRTRDFYSDFANALGKADAVILADIYPAREEPIPGVTSQLIATEMQKSGYKNVRVVPDELIVQNIVDATKYYKLIITMGAGDIWKYGELALRKVQNRA